MRLKILFIVFGLLFLTACGDDPKSNSTETLISSEASASENDISLNKKLEDIWQQGSYKEAMDSYPSLNAEELQPWNAYFQDPFAGHLLLSDYKQAADIDYRSLLGDASFEVIDKMVISEEDMNLLKMHFTEWNEIMPGTDVFKIEEKDLDNLFRKYLGISLEQIDRNVLPFYFLEETKTFYGFLDETNYAEYVIDQGVRVDDSLVLLHWKVTGKALAHLIGMEGFVVMKEETDGGKVIMNKRQRAE